MSRIHYAAVLIIGLAFLSVTTQAKSAPLHLTEPRVEYSQQLDTTVESYYESPLFYQHVEAYVQAKEWQFKSELVNIPKQGTSCGHTAACIFLLPIEVATALEDGPQMHQVTIHPDDGNSWILNYDLDSGLLINTNLNGIKIITSKALDRVLVFGQQDHQAIKQRLVKALIIQQSSLSLEEIRKELKPFQYEENFEFVLDTLSQHHLSTNLTAGIMGLTCESRSLPVNSKYLKLIDVIKPDHGPEAVYYVLDCITKQVRSKQLNSTQLKPLVRRLRDAMCQWQQHPEGWRWDWYVGWESNFRHYLSKDDNGYQPCPNALFKTISDVRATHTITKEQYLFVANHNIDALTPWLESQYNGNPGVRAARLSLAVNGQYSTEKLITNWPSGLSDPLTIETGQQLIALYQQDNHQTTENWILDGHSDRDIDIQALILNLLNSLSISDKTQLKRHLPPPDSASTKALNIVMDPELSLTTIRTWLGVDDDSWSAILKRTVQQWPRVPLGVRSLSDHKGESEGSLLRFAVVLAAKHRAQLKELYN